MKKHILKYWSKLLIATILLGLLWLWMIFFDNSTSPSTFAQQGQPCANLAWRSPGSTPDGGSVSGYKLTGATYSQTCTQLSKKLICNDGSFNLADANTYKYQNCNDQTRANCTPPTAPATGTHRITWRVLYKSSLATPTETCMQLSKNLQCVNGHFTGIDANLYQSATCQDQNRLPCINAWTNSYIDHLDVIQWYTAAVSNQTRSCNGLKINLKCMNGQRSGSNGQSYSDQSSLSSWCVDSWIVNCQFTLGDGTLITLQNWQTDVFYKPATLSWQTCATGVISCSNGQLGGQYQVYNYSSCTLSQWTGCHFTGGNNTVINIPNGGSQTLRSNNIVPYGGTCSSGVISCTNGNLIGPYLLYKYVWPCVPASPLDCSFTGGNWVVQTIGNGSTGTFYSTVRRAITGQNYSGDCTQYSWALTCHNGVIQWGVEIYRYDWGECMNPSPKNCPNLRQGWPIAHGTVTWYSVQTAAYPKKCDDYATRLTCVNGLLNGNYQQYKYDICDDTQGRPTVDVDLELKVDTPTAPDIIRVAQYSAPQLNIAITNKWRFALSGSFNEWFLQCERGGINIYKSRVIAQFVANPMIPQSLSITLKDIFTQSLGSDKHVTCRLNRGSLYYTGEATNGQSIGGGNIMDNNVRSWNIEVVTADRFDIAMERAIAPIKGNLDAPEITSALGGAETIKEFVYKKVMDILVPLIVVIGILVSILWFYKMFFSTDDTATQEGVKYIAYGLIGIIIIMSAKFIGTTMFTMLSESELSWSVIAQWVYNDLVYPFIKLAMYLVLSVMFVVLVGRVLTFLFGSSDDAKKKAWTIIGRNIIAMIVIIGAKQIVEAIYGKVVDASGAVKDISNLWEIGSGILTDKNIPILYHVINRAMGLTSLAVLIIIIFQTVQLLMKPDNPEQMKSLKNSLIYVFIGLMVIGAGYLITNFLIVS